MAWFSAQRSVLLSRSAPWNNWCRKKVQCSIVGEKKKKMLHPSPLSFPSPTIKYKVQNKATWKWWTPGSESFPGVKPCGQIPARAILEQLGCHPSLFSVGNKVHVLEAVSLTFYPVIQIFPNNLQHLYTQETLKEKDAGLQLFFLPFANE